MEALKKAGRLRKAADAYKNIFSNELRRQIKAAWLAASFIQCDVRGWPATDMAGLVGDVALFGVDRKWLTGGQYDAIAPHSAYCFVDSPTRR
jgi:hypothetical protein